LNHDNGGDYDGDIRRVHGHADEGDRALPFTKWYKFRWFQK